MRAPPPPARFRPPEPRGPGGSALRTFSFEPAFVQISGDYTPSRAHVRRAARVGRSFSRRFLLLEHFAAGLISVLYGIQHVQADAMSGEKALWARQRVAHPEVTIIFRYTKCTLKDKRQFALTAQVRCTELWCTLEPTTVAARYPNGAFDPRGPAADGPCFFTSVLFLARRVTTPAFVRLDIRGFYAA